MICKDRSLTSPWFIKIDLCHSNGIICLWDTYCYYFQEHMVCQRFVHTSLEAVCVPYGTEKLDLMFHCKCLKNPSTVPLVPQSYGQLDCKLSDKPTILVVYGNAHFLQFIAYLESVLRCAVQIYNAAKPTTAGILMTT